MSAPSNNSQALAAPLVRCEEAKSLVSTMLMMVGGSLSVAMATQLLEGVSVDFWAKASLLSLYGG